MLLPPPDDTSRGFAVTEPQAGTDAASVVDASDRVLKPGRLLQVSASCSPVGDAGSAGLEGTKERAGTAGSESRD